MVRSTSEWQEMGVYEAASGVLNVVMAESIGLASVVYHTVVGVHVVQVPEHPYQHVEVLRVEVRKGSPKTRTEEEICFNPACL